MVEEAVNGGRRIESRGMTQHVALSATWEA